MSVGMLVSLNHMGYLYVNTSERFSERNSLFYLKCFCKGSRDTPNLPGLASTQYYLMLQLNLGTISRNKIGLKMTNG